MLAALLRTVQRGEDPDFSARMLAARNGDTAGVLALVSRADVIARGEWGRTALFHAAENGHTETVRALTACGADVSAADVRGETPLFIAARRGHTETVRAMVACGADVSTASKDGFTPVYAAAESGHTETVLELAACGTNVNTASSRGWGFTPLYVADLLGNTETVRALVREFGADVDTTISLGFTPLHAAAQRGHAETVWTLVREGGAELHRAREQRLVFAMALHPRLGGGSRAASLDEDVLRMVLGPHVSIGPAASEMAAENGHARAARVLRFLEEYDGLAQVHAAANAARRAGFECPVCLESAGESLALVPCGHQVCHWCWAQIQSRGERCPMCRDMESLAVDPETFPKSAPLRQRFCVQVWNA
jgi:hypothetical protein